MPPDGKKNFLSLVQDKMIGDHYSVARGIPEFDECIANVGSKSPSRNGFSDRCHLLCTLLYHLFLEYMRYTLFSDD